MEKCYNELRISGFRSLEEMDDFMEKAKDDEAPLSFYNFTSFDSPPTFKDAIAIIGTKSDTYDCTLAIEDLSLMYTFGTAYKPPLGFYAILEELYPHLSINYAYEDPWEKQLEDDFEPGFFPDQLIKFEEIVNCNFNDDLSYFLTHAQYYGEYSDIELLASEIQIHGSIWDGGPSRKDIEGIIDKLTLGSKEYQANPILMEKYN